MGRAKLACRVIVIVALVALPRPAAAGEVGVATGTSGALSTWRGDGAIAQSLRAGYRIGDIVSLDAMGRFGYASVDQRFLTTLALGATIYGRLGKFRPYGGIFVVHQHEEPMPAMRANPVGALAGIGDGIRHRAGPAATLGVELPVYTQRTMLLYVAAQAEGNWFPDERGPSLYVGGALWVGVHYGL